MAATIIIGLVALLATVTFLYYDNKLDNEKNSKTRNRKRK